MTTLDFTPGSGASPWPRMVVAHAVTETRLLLRNGEQVVLAVVIPVLVLIGGVYSESVLDLGEGRRIDVITPGVLALAVLSTAFTSLAIATGFERRYGVLKRLGGTPLPRFALLLGKAGSVLVVEAMQIALLCSVAAVLGWRPDVTAAGIAGSAALIALGTAAFASLALLMAGTLRAEATLAAANLVFVLLLVGGGVIIPGDAYPAALEPMVGLLPSGALAEGLRAFGDGTNPGLGPFAVLATWAIVAGAITSRSFTWD